MDCDQYDAMPVLFRAPTAVYLFALVFTGVALYNTLPIGVSQSFYVARQRSYFIFGMVSDFHLSVCRH